MKNIEDLDQLIKTGMEGFAPQAPTDVWSQISGKIQTPVGSEAHGLLQGIKQASLAIKTMVVASSIAVVGLGVYVFQPEPKLQEASNIIQANEKPSLKDESILKLEENQIEEMPKPSPVKSRIVQKENVKSTDVTSVQAEPKHEEHLIVAIPESKMPEKRMVENPKTTQDGVDIISFQENFDSEENENEEEKIEFPEPKYGNVFSPNADGKNDRWEIIMPTPNFFRVRIFNQYGNLVFESDQPEKTWNGVNVKNGMECENGSYAFQIEYQYSKQNKVKILNGFVKLIR